MPKLQKLKNMTEKQKKALTEIYTLADKLQGKIKKLLNENQPALAFELGEMVLFQPDGFNLGPWKRGKIVSIEPVINEGEQFYKLDRAGGSKFYYREQNDLKKIKR